MPKHELDFLGRKTLNEASQALCFKLGKFNLYGEKLQ